MTEQAKKPAPRRARGERAPTVNFTMRLKPSLLEDLKRSASIREHSVAAEAERRLSQPEVNDLGRFLGLATRQIEERMGKKWSEDKESRSRVRSALDAMLRIVLGDAIDFKAASAKHRVHELDETRDDRIKSLILEVYPFIEDKEIMQELFNDWFGGIVGMPHFATSAADEEK